MPKDKNKTGVNPEDKNSSEEEELLLKEKKKKEQMMLDLQYRNTIANRIAEVEPPKVQAKEKDEYKPAVKESFLRSLGHKLYSGLCAISAATIGGLTWLFTAPFTRREKEIKSVVTTTDPAFIPGTKKGKFDMTLPADENQEILDDKRRIPLIFEEPILEDTDAKPTISFNFSQDTEGRSTDIGNAHGSVTIKYTKKDPVSGKLQRYKASFGFAGKEGFGTATTGFAQAQNGMLIPGHIRNDKDFASTIGVEFEVSNKQINQVILAAQQFEKGGYNMFERNCCTFVHDMGVAAGLGDDVDKFMQITDVEIGKLSLAVPGAGLISFIGAPAVSRIGRTTLIDMKDKIDYSYQQYGKKGLNTQDIENLSKMRLNIRMRGYMPSKTAENIRKLKNVKLISNGYATQNIKLSRAAERSNNAIANLKKTLKNEIKDKRLIESVNNTLNEFSEGIKEYNNEMQLISGFKRTAKDKQNVMTNEEKISGLEKMAEKIRGLKEKLNDMYQKNFGENKALNIAFHKVYAGFEHCQSVIDKTYNDVIKDRTLSIDKKSQNYYDNDKYKGLIDYSRDSSEAIKTFQYGSFTLKNERGEKETDVSVAEYVANIRTFGSFDMYMKYKRLESNGERTPSEEKEFNMLKERSTAISEFKKAEESFLSNRKFTTEDYKFAIVDLRLAEMKSNYKYDQEKTPMKISEVYQTIAMERAFPGLKNELKKLNVAQIANHPEEFKKVINNFLTNKLEDKSNKELNKLQEAMIETTVELNPVKITKDNVGKYQKDIFYKSHNLIMDCFKKVYLKSIMTELVHDKVANMAKDEKAAKAEELLNGMKLGELDFDKDPSFASMRRAASKNLGVEFDRPENVPQKIEPTVPEKDVVKVMS